MYSRNTIYFLFNNQVSIYWILKSLSRKKHFLEFSIFNWMVDIIPVY